MTFIELLKTSTGTISPEVVDLLHDADGRLQHIARRLNAQWDTFQHLAEPGFIKNFGLKPHQYWWEMYLGSELVRSGHHVSRSGPRGGPDFIFAHGSQQFSIEAVAPGPGSEDNPDRVPPLIYGKERPCPRDETVIRFQQSIVRDKSKSLKKYLSEGVIPDGSINLVAVSGSQFDYPGIETMAASVLPIGPLTMWVGSDGSPSYVEPAMETELTRQRGFRVSKTGFRDGTLAHIAGVIFYPGSLFNSSTPSDEFFLVRNATASHQIPDGVLSFVTEWPNA